MKDYSTLQSKVNALKAKVELNSITPAMMGAVLDDFIAMMKEIDMTDLRPPYTSLFTDLATALSIARDAMAKAEANETAINTVLGPGASQAIENFGEIIAFLAGCKDDETLQGILNNLRTNLQDLQDQIDTLTDTGDTRWKSTKAWAEGNAADIKALDAKVAVEAFDGPLASDSGEGLWFDDGTGKFVVKASDGTVSDAGEAYNWLPTPELAGIGAKAHGRTDKVYRDGAGGLWHVVYDAEAENHIILQYVDEALHYADLESLEKQVEQRMDACDGYLRKEVGIVPFDGMETTVSEAEGYSAGAVVYSQTDNAFMALGSTGEWSRAGERFNKAVAEGQQPAQAGPREGCLFRLGKALYRRGFNSVGAISLVALVDGSELEGVVRALQQATGVYPFDILLEHHNELGTSPKPGSIAYVEENKVFYIKSPEGGWVLAGSDYNNAGGTGPTDNIFRFGNNLYVRAGLSVGLTSLVTNRDLTYSLASKAEKEAVYKVFDDAWTADGGTVIESGVSYGLNGLTLTLAEAIEVEKLAVRSRDDVKMRLRYTKVRTNIVRFQSAYYLTIGITFFAHSSDAEVLRLAPGDSAWVGDTDEAFNGCRKLRSILTTLVDFNGNSAMYWWRNAFKNCVALEDVKILGLKGPVSFGDSPRLTMESLQYTVEHVNTEVSGIVITVHADTYAKLTGDTTNAACAALTDEERAEWSALCVTAGEKGITIASA